MLSWGLAVFIPLWFIGVYAVVTALTPWTAAAIERHGLGALGAELAAVTLVDLAGSPARCPGSDGPTASWSS